MAFVPGYKSRLLLGDFSLSAYITDVTAPMDVEMLDVTTMADAPVRKFIPGRPGGTFSTKGFLDPDGTSNAQYDQINTWSGNEPITYGPNGLALGAETWLVDALKTTATTGAALSSPVSFDLAAQCTGLVDINGVSLHDLTAETADGNGTGVDGGASSTGGAVAHLHSTAFSGLTGNIVIVEDSANNSLFATIGTFTTVAGLTSQRLVIAGTVRRYVRCSWDVTGTGSNTFAVAIARR
jgi:hypothetical protein